MRVLLALFIFYLPFVALAQSDTTKQPISLQEVIIVDGTENLNEETKGNKNKVQAPIHRLLDEVPGVSLIRRGNFALEPTVRGLNGAQINLSIDGMAIFGACTDKMDPISSYIEPNNLKSITINYSSDAQSYGSSIGGGFNFRTIKPVLNAPDTWTGRLGVGYNSNGNALQSLASISYSNKVFAMNINGIFRRSENYTAGGGQEILFSQYHKWNGSISAKYKIADKHILAAQYLQDRGYDIGYPALTMDVAYANANIASLTYIFKGNGNGWTHWETKVYYNHIHHVMDDTQRPPEMVPMHMDMPGISTTMGLYSESKWSLGKRNHLALRLDFYRNRYHAEMTMYPDAGDEMFMLTIPDGQRSVLGLSFTDHQIISDVFSVTFGGRIENNASSLYTEQGENTLSGFYPGDLGRFKLISNFFVNPEVQLNDNWTLFAQIARGMRAPSLREMYGFYLFDRADNYDYIGNPNLHPESSWNLSLNTTYTSPRLRIKAKVFTYLFQDYITGIIHENYNTMTIGASGVKVYNNLPSARLYGADFNINLDIIEHLRIGSSNSFTYAYDNKHRALPLIPPFKSSNSLTYKRSSYAFYVEGIFSLAQMHVNHEFYGESTTPSYFLANIGLRKEFTLKTSSIFVNLRLNNVFDKKYHQHLDIMQVPRLGRNLIVQISYEF